MKYYVMPADFKNETIDRYHELNKQYAGSKVIETYGQVSLGDFLQTSACASGRLIYQIPQVNLGHIKDYIEYSRKKDIDFNCTVNAAFMNNREFTKEGVGEIIDFLDDLYNAGVRWLTVTMPSLVELIRNTKYDFKIKASTICSITNANRALWLSGYGVDRFVVDENITNRDFGNLRRMRKAVGDNVEIMVNCVCHKACLRLFHFNQVAGSYGPYQSVIGDDYYPHRCILRKFEDVSNFVRIPFVRPEDVKYYEEIGISYFKFQGRHLVLNGDPVRAVECYFKESYDGNLMDLLEMFRTTNSFKIYLDNKKLDGFIKPFYEQDNFCKCDCKNCGYCERYAKKAIDFDAANEIGELAREFYDEYDGFKNLVKSVEREKKQELKLY